MTVRKNMKEKILCPLCKREMVWFMDTLFCTVCDMAEIFEISPNTMCSDFEKKYKRKEK